MRMLPLRPALIALTVLGIMLGSGGIRKAEARPIDVLALDPFVVNALTQAACAPSCDLTNPADLLAVAEADGDGDMDADDFASVDVDGNQLNADTGVLWIVAFLTNDGYVWLDADEGVFGESGSSQAECPTDFADEDCDDDGDWSGDGVVVATLEGGGVADEGDAILTVSQSGIDVEIDYWVVGDATGSISGTVVDDHGSPIQSCRLRADPMDEEGQDGSAYTNAEGFYTIRYLETGDFTVEAWCDGYPRQYYDGKSNSDYADPVHVVDGQNTLDINFTLIAPPTPTPTPVPAQEVIATIQLPPDSGPWAVAVNSVTNRVYVSNPGADTVSVIDGATNSVIATIGVGEGASGLSVNPTTNRVFVANYDDGSVSVIDGATNDVITSVPMEGEPDGVAVNPDTNLVYVDSFNYVWVIDGASNTVVASIPIYSIYPGTVTVNPVTNCIYVGRARGYGIAKIDGTTNEIIDSIPLGGWPGGWPHFLAVNPFNNRIYAHANSDFPYFWSSLYVIDGNSASVVATFLDLHTGDVDVNPTTGHVFFATYRSGYVASVLDEATDTVIANVPVGEHPDGVGVNPVTNRVYVASYDDDTITVISDPVETTPTPTSTATAAPTVQHRRATATARATETSTPPTATPQTVVQPTPTVQPPVSAVAPVISLPPTGGGSRGGSAPWTIGLALMGLSLVLGSGAVLLRRTR
jgi:YVTN family beta-propeller protein